MVSRFRVLEAAPPPPSRTFEEEVRSGLEERPRTLPYRFLYDDRGTLLFEQICEVDDYYPTQAELEILERHATEMVDRGTLAELGSGSARKARFLVEAGLDQRESLEYLPIDISQKAVEICAEELVGEFDRVQVTGVVGEYLSGVHKVCEVTDEGREFFWLGGSVGNMHRKEAAEFLGKVRRELGSDDRIFVGIDLRKERDVLERAYDDSDGVTSQFNLNLLRRINRELGGNFELDQFRHRAEYNSDEGRVELFIESQQDQTVAIADLDLSVDFQAGERIHTENSYKYSKAEIQTLAERSGLELGRQWFDGERRFSVNEFVPV